MRSRWTAVAAVALCLAVPAAPADAASTRWARAVDGDTIQLSNGTYVRLLGYDTPEAGQCGYTRARAAMAGLVRGGITLKNRSGRDRYGRILAYVRTSDGRDIGSVMLRSGLAVARYDSTDGYGWHPKQAKYHRLDRRNGIIVC